ncbi:hypothetical protein, partial [Gemmiger sp.]|uniref:hypothetical protein n=1 Tax=Gemmiger sp. TaxID=2049027 RepID=UPI003F1045EB
YFFEFLFTGNSCSACAVKMPTQWFFYGAALEMSFSATRCLARQLIYNTTLSAKVNPFFQFFSTYFFPVRIWGPVLWRGTGCGGPARPGEKNGALCLSLRRTSCALLYK